MLYLKSFCDVAESTILQAVAVLFDHAAVGPSDEHPIRFWE